MLGTAGPRCPLSGAALGPGRRPNIHGPALPTSSASPIRTWPGSCDAGGLRPHSRPCAPTWAGRRNTRGRRPYHARPAGTLQSDRRDRACAAAGPASAARAEPSGTEPYASTVTNSPTLMRATLWTGEPSCAQSRPRPTCQNRRRCTRNTFGPSSTAPPEHNRNRDAAVIPVSPSPLPAWTGRNALYTVSPRLQHGSATGGFQTCYLSTVNWVTINVPVLTAVVFK